MATAAPGAKTKSSSSLPGDSPRRVPAPASAAAGGKPVGMGGIPGRGSEEGGAGSAPAPRGLDAAAAVAATAAASMAKSASPEGRRAAPAPPLEAAAAVAATAAASVAKSAGGGVAACAFAAATGGRRGGEALRPLGAAASPEGRWPLAARNGSRARRPDGCERSTPSGATKEPVPPARKLPARAWDDSPTSSVVCVGCPGSR
mmetsp:Transcript_71486/g.232319  ORF Transcript_71486/g.232319 Transcript_71486/m.232319 type:complete len:203 (-) Transcript_71486:1606-2214(-)